MEYKFKVGDRVMGTKDALSHRVGKFGRVTRPQGKSSVFVLWDGADQDHFVHKNEIVRIEEEPMYNMTQEPKLKGDSPTLYRMLLWRDMTPEEKGALLLAHHEGKVIEVFGGDGYHDMWHDRLYPSFEDDCAYRIKPEPKRETLKLYGKNGWYDPAIGTIDLIDGKPDLASIKIEEV